jgi:hypothetical protein
MSQVSGAVAIARRMEAVQPQTLVWPALVWPALVAAAAGAAVVPLWAGEFLPFQDAPQHLAAVRVLADYHSPEFGFEKWFELDLGRLQYLGFYLPAALLAKVTNPDIACRLCLSLIALALPVAFWMLLDALGRDRRLAVFAPAVFHTAPLHLGFFNFVACVPAAIAVVALGERELRAPRTARAVVLALAVPMLLWLHPSGLAFALATAVTLALTSGLPRRRQLRALLPFLPAVPLLGAWALQAVAARDGAGAVGKTPPFWLPLQDRAADLLRFGNVIPGRIDELVVAALVALLVGAALVRGGKAPPRAWRVPLLTGLTLLAYFCAPYDLGYMGYVALRAVPFLVLLAIACPSLAPGRLTSALCAAAVAIQLAYSGVLVRAAYAFEAEAEAPALAQVLRAAEPGKRLFAVIPDQKSQVVHFRPYMHFGAYYQLLRGGRSRYNFAETPWTPVRYRKETEPEPWPRSWDLNPERIVPSRDAGDDEYLLVRTPIRDPGPRFHLRASAGRWALYSAER